MGWRPRNTLYEEKYKQDLERAQQAEAEA